MDRIRTIDGAFEHILSVDEKTALTRSALRKLVISGKIPSQRVGKKYLLSLDDVENFLSGSPTESVQSDFGKIRRL